MSIATVIVFWTFVEVLGHIGIMKEIWLEPMEHLGVMIALLVVFLALGIFTLYNAFFKE